MEKFYLTYDAIHGIINDWLILGPVTTSLDSSRKIEETEMDFRKGAIVSFSPDRPLSDQSPTQLEKINHGIKELFWKLVHCKPDHRIEASQFSSKWEYAQVWAYSSFISPVQGQYSASLITGCASSVWLNGRKIFRTEDINQLGMYGERTYPIDLLLNEGENQLWLLLENVSNMDMVLSAQFRLIEDIPQLKVAIPVLSRDLDYWKIVEGIYAKLSMNRAIYSFADTLVLNCPAGLPWTPKAVLRISTPSGRIFGEFDRELKAGEISLGISGNQLPSGDLELMVMPPLDDYYQKQFRVSRSIPFQVINEKFYSKEEVPYEKRLADLVEAAAGREDLVAEYTKLKLGWSVKIDPNISKKAIDCIRTCESGCISDLLSLLVIASFLVKENKVLPDEIRSIILEFSYKIPNKSLSPTETEQLYYITCQILSGQLYPETIFSRSGLYGKEEQSQGEMQALEWLQNYSWYGFLDWNPDLNSLIPALVVLSDYAKNEQVREIAAIFLDKQLYLFALTSWKGCSLPIGSRISASQLKSERLHPHAPLGMLLWGQGNNNLKSDATIYLGLSEGYSIPDIIRSIAQDHESTIWAAQKDVSFRSSDDEVTQVIYKTPDYLLSSAQNHSQGKAGKWEHLWQAVLGTEAVVFTNLPGSYSQSDSRPIGFWRGNSSMPRLEQWHDSLVCIYDPKEPYPLGFTHAYFPLYCFDEYKLKKNWAFARKDDAYIAVYALNGLELVTEGDDAFRELRSFGVKNIWCCQMGRKSEDHSFDDFCYRVSSSSPEINDSLISWHTVRDQKIVFSWDEKLIINRESVQLLENKQMESQYGEAPLPAYTVDIKNQGDLLRLDFS
jgi:hypothetical protein